MALALSICVAGPIYAGPSFAHELNRETAVVKAVRAVSPAVVNISSAYEVRKRSSPFSGFGLNPFFEEFFRDFYDPRFERRQQHTSLGSGVIIDGTKGLILTNAHVIQKTGTIKVILKNELEFEARIVGADPDSDTRGYRSLRSCERQTVDREQIHRFHPGTLRCACSPEKTKRPGCREYRASER